MKKVIVQPGQGMPRPTVFKHTIKPSAAFIPHVYSREVRRPWTGAELRELRKLRGVGPVKHVKQEATDGRPEEGDAALLLQKP